MYRKKHRLRNVASRFLNSVRTVEQQLSDGLSYFNKALQRKPCTGPGDYREALSCITDQVSELSQQAETLESFVLDTISFEELLGHCLGLYQENRSSAQCLKEHLQQYGWEEPPDIAVEPENPVCHKAVAAADGAAGEEGPSSEDDGDADPLGCPVTTSRFPCSSGLPLAAAKGPGARAGELEQCATEKQAGLDSPCGPTHSLCDGIAGRQGGHHPMAGQAVGQGRHAGGGGSESADAAPMDISDDEECGARAQPAARRQYLHQPIASLAPAPLRAGFDAFSRGGQGTILKTGFHDPPPRVTTARKLPRPSVDSHASTTPETELSPSMKKLLAKYNPPSDSDHVAAVSFDFSSGTAAKGPGLPAPTGGVLQREGDVAAATAPASCGNPGGQSGTGWQDSTHVFQAPAPRHAADELRERPPSPEDTCALYRNLIRSQVMPGSLMQQAPKPSLAAAGPPQPLQLHQQPQAPQLALGQASTANGAAANGSWAQSQHLAPQPAGAAPTAALTNRMQPPPPLGVDVGSAMDISDAETPKAPRWGTPLSIRRAEHKNRQSEKKTRDKQADKLVEQFADLQTKMTDLSVLSVRRSYGGGVLGAGGDGAGGFSFANAIARAKSPGPSRAAGLAADPAATGHGGTRADVAASRPVAWAQPGSEQEDPDLGRSPLQPKALSTMLGASPPARSTRASCLPSAPGLGAPTAPPSTVVGATFRDLTATAAAAAVGGSLKATAAAVAVKRTPGRLPRTPGRLPQRPSSPPGATPMLTGRAGIEAPTPRTATRVPMPASSAALFGPNAVDFRGPKATPMRKSIAGSFPGLAAASAGVASREQEQQPQQQQARNTAVTLGQAERTAAPPGLSHCLEAEQGTGVCQVQTRNVAAPAPACEVSGIVPVLPLAACIRTEEGSRSSSGEANDEWQGFPLSRRGDGSQSNGDAARAEVDVVLPQPPMMQGTPTGGTPGRRTPGGRTHGTAAVAATSTAGPPAAGACMSRVQAATHMVLNVDYSKLSPESSVLMSRVVQQDQARHAPAAGHTGLSRIPTPINVATQSRTAAAVGPSTRSLGGADNGGAIRAAAAGAVAASAAAVAAAAAVPLPPDVEPISDAEWRSLGPTSQAKFPLDVLNSQLNTIHQLVASRPGGTAEAGVSVQDLEAAFSLTTAKAKLLANVFFKLNRFKPLPSGGAQVYSLRLSKA